MAQKQRYPAMVCATLLVSIFHDHVHAHGAGQIRRMDFGFPDCVSNCVESAGCSATDVKCMCRASQGSFLPDVVSCMYDACTQSLPVDVLLNPLELACEVLGKPIPDSAISSAEAAATSSDSPQPTTTTPETSKTTTTQTSTPKTTYPVGTSTPTTSHSKGTTTLPASTGTTTTTTSTKSSATPKSTSTTKGAGVTTTASTTETSLSFHTSTQSTSDSGTTTDTGGPTDPTDSTPFASPIASGRREQPSWLAAVVGLGVLVIFGW
ncbi:hypothetical protein BJ170DRAFT_446499 [Xylariales sp. AK1849]|nr:hypothetical protein BJ170DRAFT_446499 [Xylariales sp. AK1849]